MSNLVFTPGVAAPQRTLLILGPARSKTSFLAGMLHFGGIHFDQSTPTFEDLPLSEAMERHDTTAFDAILEDRNRRDSWGWKRPSIGGYWNEVVPKLRMPHAIMLTRDVTAIALRAQIAHAGQPRVSLPELQRKMLVNLNIQRNLMKKAADSGIPLMCVSAEKMSAAPVETARACAAFFHHDLDTAPVEDFIAQGNAAYEDYARD
ncbi:hypothetical protein [Roseivivax sediminis]|uniref:Sulfotransferase family protein n=1 Tax=Roseivivax sediminis TaxID=936889 RepID=A0A1I1X8Q2_9RHOB|nr:hypothetical protein [Roseivivax sediminis]SFE02988.1 hypothetical protein SAMN04515678_105258 [Roseivivax sediminis]